MNAKKAKQARREAKGGLTPGKGTTDRNGGSRLDQIVAKHAGDPAKCAAEIREAIAAAKQRHSAFLAEADRVASHGKQLEGALQTFEALARAAKKPAEPAKAKAA